MTKPIASVSLDLDNLWSYLKTHGDPEWADYPSYLDTFVPLILDILDEWGIRITFFIVGRDAALDKNRAVLKTIADRGHDIGNHSFDHEVWLHSHPKDKIRDELQKAEDHIHSATGRKPAGFRGPGFVWSVELLEVLTESGYDYDASMLPTFIGPLARMYYFWKSDLSPREKSKRGKIYSSFKAGFRPVKPYFWDMGTERNLLEFPVTTIPIVKTPFHLSYLIYLSRFSKTLMLLYFHTALALCRTFSTPPSFLLHPLDIIGGESVHQLKFFPGMDLSGAHKLEVFQQVMAVFCRHFTLVDMTTHARHLKANCHLRKIRV